MKTKSITKFFGLILSVLMFVTLACGMTVTASAAEAGSAEIVGQNVNLGGDIEMKYYVELGAGVTIDQVKLQTVFLGVEKFLTTTETYTTEDGRTLYVFTLEGITPQCMGDDIDAVLYVDNAKVDSNLLDYSVKDNLVSLYNDETTDEKTKQLIVDTLEYGAAAQNYRGYKTDALVTADFAAATSDDDVLVPVNNPVLDDKSEAVSVSANVRYSTINYLLFGLTGADSFDGKVTIGDSAVTGTTIDGYYAVATGAISPENFHQDFTMKYYNGEADYVTLTYSVNDYCHAAYTNGAQNMKDLAIALYNYGLSAHKYLNIHSGGTATCLHGKYCAVCGYEYDTTTDPNNHEKEEFTYTANTDGTTHTKKYKCCGAVANASEAHDHTNGKCVCGVLPTPDYTVPTNLTATYGDTLANVTLPAGFTWQDAETTSVGNAGSNTFKVTYTPEDTENYKTVSDIEVTIQVAKADPEYTVPTGLTVYVGQTLNDIDLPSGWTWHPDAQPDFVFTSDIAVNQIAVAIYTPEDTLNYNTIEEGIPFTVLLLPIDGATVTVSGTHTYNGSAITPDVTVMIGEKTLTKGTDYTVSYSDNVNAGTATVTITGKGDYTGTVSTTFTIEKATPAVTTKPAAVENLEYTGEARTLVTAGTASGGEVQYKLGENGTYSTTIPAQIAVGTYTVYWKVVGDSNHNDTAEQSITVTISANAVAEEELNVTGYDASYTYTGEAIKPEDIIITVDGKELVKDTDYEISYGENQYVGEGTITITFKGNYSGTATVTFTITSAKGTGDFISDWVPVG